MRDMRGKPTELGNFKERGILRGKHEVDEGHNLNRLLHVFHVPPV
jgi:hypothetical protein